MFNETETAKCSSVILVYNCGSQCSKYSVTMMWQRFPVEISPGFTSVNIGVKETWLPNKLAQSITILTCIWQVSCLNLGRDINHPETFRGFSQSLQAIRPLPLPSIPIPIHYSLSSGHSKQYVLKLLTALLHEHR
jgi:hypothetical protein